jgi:CHAD domain-containing protein
VADLPHEYVLGRVAADLDAALAAERADAWRRLRSAMDGKRYRALLSLLELWRTDPPLTGAGDRKPQRVAGFVADAGKNLRKRLRQAAQHETDDELFHRARKAAKRYRYANELAGPVLGEKASVAVEETKELQTLLGEHQDSVVSAGLLRRLGESAGTKPGASAFTYGVLLGQQLQRSAETRADVVLTWRGK